MKQASCLMCGAEISDGFLCEKCDKPKKAPVAKAKPASTPPPSPPPTPAAPAPAQMGSSSARAGAAIAEPVFEPFPKAPIVPFPVEATSLAITSVCDVIAAANVAAVVIGADRGIRYVSEEARKLFGADANEPATLRHVEALTGIKIQQLHNADTQQIRVGDRNVKYSLVPLSGSAGGAVLVFKSLEIPDQSPFATYVRETVLMPMRSMHDSLVAAERRGKSDPMLHDIAATIDQILTSLELASNVEEPRRSAASKSVSQIVHQIAEQFRSTAVKRSVTIQIDVPEISETFSSEVRLSSCLQTLLENALHYVPDGGQIVVGTRLMEHKEKPLLLFFVMDNGPTIPEEYRKSIFDPGFVWDPRDPVRTGGGLAKCRQFAVEHGGSIWVESKTGKACTFFLRVRPDGVF